MDPIDVLMDEHRRIERVLDALERFVATLDQDAPAPREDLDRFARFFRRYADAGHHGKEEDILFRHMIEAGMPLNAGPIAVMLEDHETGRQHVGVLAQAASGSGPLETAERDGVRDTALAFAAHLRGHIQKEDQVLYPMAQRNLPAEAWTAMAESFEGFERERTGEQEELHALSQDLVGRFGA